MKRFAGSVVLGLMICSFAMGQNYNATIIHTQPKAPAWDMLRRLDLVKAFHTRIKMEGRRDAISSIDVIPHETGSQLLVQTRYGRISLIDAETGDILWTTPVGIPFRDPLPPTFNSNSIFTTRRDHLFILNRKNGLHRVYTTDPFTKVRTLGFKLPVPQSATPAAGDQLIFFNMTSRVVAYTLPPFEFLDKIKAEGKTKTAVAPTPDESAVPTLPEFKWGYTIGAVSLLQKPLLTAGRVVVIASNGELYSLNQFQGTLATTFRASDDVSVPMGQHGDIAYITSDDENLFALNMVNGELTWRFLTEGRVKDRIIVNDENVFIAPMRRGLVRLHRKTGEALWRQPRATRFVSAGKRFVFAVNERGQLLIIGYPRGDFLASFDMSAWNVPVTNEWTDRIYFAANDGQILCLRHRDNVQPVNVKSWNGIGDDKVDNDKKNPKAKPLGAWLQRQDQYRLAATFEPAARARDVLPLLALFEVPPYRHLAPKGR